MCVSGCEGVVQVCEYPQLTVASSPALYNL